jgi:hypothetical protein
MKARLQYRTLAIVIYGEMSATGGRTTARVCGDFTTSQDGLLQLLRMNRGQEWEFIVGKGSMRKTPVICSLLMAFGMSTLMIGCEPAAKQTKPAGKVPGNGSTTGGGAEVPAAPSKGAEEKPTADAAPAAEEKTEAAPAVEEKTDAAPAGDEKPKTEG